MDVSYSAWQHSAQESMVLKGDSFSFLFDRRYTNRLNRMSRIFFEAYSKATNELSVKEDRFPSLSEIDTKMESGAVYAFKDRLTKNTEFFEEVKISGVSYLVPKAKRFVDATGMYTDLAFNFEEAAVLLPTRRKVPADAEMSPPKDDSAAKEEFVKVSEEQARAYPVHAPEAYEEEEEKPSEPPEPEDKRETLERPAEPAFEMETPGPEDKRPELKGEGAQSKARAIIPALIVLAVLLSLGVYLFTSFSPSGTPKLVHYSSYISNEAQGEYLGLDIANKEGINNDLEMVLPPNIDKSISSRGGVITISHVGNTVIKLNSTSDASIRIYLSSNWSAVPVTLSLAIPHGYYSGLTVNGTDYDIKRKDDKIVLRFNSSREGIGFEQSYSPKR